MKRYLRAYKKRIGWILLAIVIGCLWGAVVHINFGLTVSGILLAIAGGVVVGVMVGVAYLTTKR